MLSPDDIWGNAWIIDPWRVLYVGCSVLWTHHPLLILMINRLIHMCDYYYLYNLILFLHGYRWNLGSSLSPYVSKQNKICVALMCTTVVNFWYPLMYHGFTRIHRARLCSAHIDTPIEKVSCRQYPDAIIPDGFIYWARAGVATRRASIATSACLLFCSITTTTCK
jgi:hypothetical protein